MDPDANLREQREIIAGLHAELDAGAWDVSAGRVERLVELSRALDEWLSRGGFLPSEWARP